MDLTRVEEANRAIQEGIRAKFPNTLVSFSGLTNGRLIVGHCDRIHVVLQDVLDKTKAPTGRHSIVVETGVPWIFEPLHEQKTRYKETNGWFPFDRIVSYICECIANDTRGRVADDIRRLAMTSAKSLATQLAKTHDLGSVLLAPDTDQPGSLTVSIPKLSYEKADKILAFVCSLLAQPKDGQRDLWDHLNDD